MFQRILVVFEGERVYKQALSYSRELALRMDSEVAFLMLVKMGFKDQSVLSSKRRAVNHLRERAGKMLRELTAGFIEDGITVSVAVRFGNPTEEFLRFLSERSPFQAVIWGRAAGLVEWSGPVAALLER